MLTNAANSIMLAVDLQERLIPSIENGKNVVGQAVRLGRIASALEIPVIGTEQNPISLGKNVHDITQLCGMTIAKHHFDGCADGLVDAIPERVRRIAVTGCEAHVCVLQTVFGLLENGFEVSLVIDAVGSRRGLDRDAAINRLRSAGVEIVTVEMIAFEWLRSSHNPRFRDILALIK